MQDYWQKRFADPNLQSRLLIDDCQHEPVVNGLPSDTLSSYLNVLWPLVHSTTAKINPPPIAARIGLARLN